MQFLEVNGLKVILFVLVITFCPIFFGSEFLTYDDNWYIYENQNVINFSWISIVNIFTKIQGGQYSPLGEVYHMVLYAFFGENATAFKISALIVHLLNTVLLFKIFDKIFEDKLLVFTVVLFFGIHPMQVETIGWISVIFRNAVLLMFLGYWYYLKYLESDFKTIKLLPVFICYFLACLTKEQAILFPVGIFLIYMIKSNYIFSKRILAEMTLWMVITIIFGLVTIEITKTGGPSIITRDVPFLKKIDLLTKSINGYCYNFLLPIDLSFSYPYPNEKSSISYFSILFALVSAVLGILISIKNKIFRFGFIWVMGFLSLALAFSFFHMRDTYMADRYAYLAVIGYSIMLYSVLKYLKNRFSINLFYGVILVFSFFFSLSTFVRVPVFKNSKNLWTQAINVNPENQYALNSLGFYYRNNGENEKALSLYKKALNIAPDYYLAHSNVGKIYFKKQEYDSALYHVSKAIELNPAYDRAYKNRAAIYNKLGNYKLLIKDLNTILIRNPNEVKYRQERVKLYFKGKQYKKAIEDAKELLNYAPKNSYANYVLGHSNLILKNYKQANLYMDRAILNDSNKGKYFFVRSLCRYRIGNLAQALKDASKAQSLKYNVDKAYLKGLVQKIKDER